MAERLVGRRAFLRSTGFAMGAAALAACAAPAATGSDDAAAAAEPAVVTW